MMDAAGGGRRNGRRRSGPGAERSGGGGGGGVDNGRGGGNNNNKRRRRKRRGGGPAQLSQRTLDRLPPDVKDESSILGGRALRTQGQGQETRRPGGEEEDGPNAFGLFCAYHLGITVDDGYQKPSLDEVARRYNLPPEEVRRLLAEFRLDAESVRNCDFDLEGAQLDIRVAPAGISRRELARELYQDFLESFEQA